MRVTTWTEYSLIISLHLAKRGRTGSGPVAARELADAERLPADYVEQILLRLRRAGLVESVRGAKGGYFLAKQPAAISVRDVMSASEHQTFEINCESHPVDAERCSPGSHVQHPAGLACPSAAGGRPAGGHLPGRPDEGGGSGAGAGRDLVGELATLECACAQPDPPVGFFVLEDVMTAVRQLLGHHGAGPVGAGGQHAAHSGEVPRGRARAALAQGRVAQPGRQREGPGGARHPPGRDSRAASCRASDCWTPRAGTPVSPTPCWAPRRGYGSPSACPETRAPSAGRC